jgi:L-asparaginase II
MGNPTLVELRRGHVIESRHSGTVAVVDADGAEVLALGEVDAPVLPRSAVKALQALPLVEAGAAELLGFGDRELALVCASHAGEPDHVDVVTGMLARVAQPSLALECGAHWPIDQKAAFDLARRGLKPLSLHNQCSGKHAGFVCLAHLIGANPAGYSDARHPVQRLVVDAIASLTGQPLGSGDHVLDGCMAPTWPVPLARLALAFAKFGTGRGLGPERAKAAARLRAACAAEAWYVGGTDRFCTDVMRRLGVRAFVKFGAEGVFCGALPEQGLGIAIKCDDGAARAAEVIMAVLLRKFLGPSDETEGTLDRFVRPPLKAWGGQEVGRLGPAPALLPLFS